jgi:hypothetical protein
MTEHRCNLLLRSELEMSGVVWAAQKRRHIIAAAYIPLRAATPLPKEHDADFRPWLAREAVRATGYAAFVNNRTTHVLHRNDSSRVVTIPRTARLGYATPLDPSGGISCAKAH